MNLAIDIYYHEKGATCIGVLFEWEDAKPRKVIRAYVDEVEEYVPGEFYKRELPCVLAVIYQVKQCKVDCILLDSYVQPGAGQKGLGEYVYEAMDEQYPVIGVAKRGFYNNADYVREVRRGESENPLYVSVVGCDIDGAAECILNMYGEHRIPTILQQVDKIGRR